MLHRIFVPLTLLLGACATTTTNDALRPAGPTYPLLPLDSAAAPLPAPSLSAPLRSDVELATLIAQETPVTATGMRIPVHTVRAYFGARALDSDYDPVDEQLSFGLEYAFQPSTSWLGVEAGYQFSAKKKSKNNTDFTVAEFDAYAGPRMTFLRQQMVQPYVGLGLALVGVSKEIEVGNTSTDDDDGSLGFYAHGGLVINPFRGFQVGLDVRIVTGTDLTLFNSDTNGDYEQVALVVGWGF